LKQEYQDYATELLNKGKLKLAKVRNR